MWESVLVSVVSGGMVGLVTLGGQYFVLPRLERNKLVAAEGWRSKRDTFTRAIQLLDRHYAASTWSGPNIPPNYVPVGEKAKGYEKNEIFAQLLLVSDDMTIPERFMHLFGKGSPQARGEFILLLRKELYGSQPGIGPDMVPYFF